MKALFSYFLLIIIFLALIMSLFACSSAGQHHRYVKRTMKDRNLVRPSQQEKNAFNLSFAIGYAITTHLKKK